MKDPKVGTGKKPKGSGRRLYTDENPSDTVRIKFKTDADARATASKVKKVNKPFARKIQILTVMEQRAKVMGKTGVVNIAKKPKNPYAKAVRSRTYQPKVIDSKKLYNRKKEKQIILKAAAIKED